MEYLAVCIKCLICSRDPELNDCTAEEGSGHRESSRRLKRLSVSLQHSLLEQQIAIG